jgi:hypothetical protein
MYRGKAVQARELQCKGPEAGVSHVAERSERGAGFSPERGYYSH